jgi:hypothetical protein
MMSSCCTFRLKRRSAFSRDSLSWIMTSATNHSPPIRVDWILSCPAAVRPLRFPVNCRHRPLSLSHGSCLTAIRRALRELRHTLVFENTLEELAGASSNQFAPASQAIFMPRPIFRGSSRPCCLPGKWRYFLDISYPDPLQNGMPLRSYAVSLIPFVPSCC